MFIKANRGMVGDYGSMRAGVTREVPDHYGKALIKAGRAIQVKSDEKPQKQISGAAAKESAAAKKAAAAQAKAEKAAAEKAAAEQAEAEKAAAEKKAE